MKQLLCQSLFLIDIRLHLLHMHTVKTAYVLFGNMLTKHYSRVTPITAEELMSADSEEKLDKLCKAQLQIVILCPSLSVKLSELKKNLNSENLFKVDKVLVMLLGVEKNHVVANNCEGRSSIFITKISLDIISVAVMCEKSRFLT